MKARTWLALAVAASAALLQGCELALIGASAGAAAARFAGHVERLQPGLRLAVEEREHEADHLS